MDTDNFIVYVKTENIAKDVETRYCLLEKIKIN